MIAKHRFDEVNSELKKLRAWRKQQEEKKSKAEEKRLASQKKFEELAEKRKKERDEAVKKFQEAQINNKIQSEATSKGIKDLDAALKLVDKSKITVEDDEIKGVDEAVGKLLENKPYLKDAHRARRC